MTKNKYHWYDGWFYDVVIAPNQDKLFIQIMDLLDPGSNVIDIGCGTGRLEFAIAGKCKSVLGIDISEKNISRARFRLVQKPNDRISFKHISVQEISGKERMHFDYAILTYVIHEVDEKDRITLLNETCSVAGKIIIGDYRVPRPGGFGSILTEVIEFVAGRDHYRNYKNFVANGGINYLAQRTGLRVIEEITDIASNNHIVILEKSI
jgi:SAM-dependent methyltransferase